MGVLVSCENLNLEYPTYHVLRDVSLGVSEGDRIGIVGKNGSGKTTLLNVALGLQEPDSGRVTMRRGVRIGFLGQRDSLDGEATVGENVVGDLAEHEWAGDPRVRSVVGALLDGIDWYAQVKTLSGGQRRRVDLARLLIGDWDVLALDEPTNHLDMKGIAWLADHLKNRWAKGEGGLLVITHDRWFLDEVCLSMWEVHDGTITPFEGGYSAYIQQRLERDRQARAMEERRQNILRKELAWLARGPQARGTKPKFRVEAARDLIADVPPMRNEIELHRLAVSRLGKIVVELKNVTQTYGDAKVLDGVDWIIGPGDRYGIMGANGAGKSTLLGVIDGSIKPTKGSVKIGQTVKFAVLSQQLDELHAHTGETVREVLGSVKQRFVIDGKECTPSQLLERLGFEPGQLLTRVEDLSGGQQRRLQLMLVLLSEPNVLILDEPGNDMDTDMLAVLEDLLDSWPGTLLLVSHDRYLMERVTDQQFMVLDGKVTHVPGGVDEFLRILAAREEGRAAASRQAGAPKAGGAGAAAGAGAAGSSASSEGAGQTGAEKSGLSRSEEYQLRKQLSSVERKIETQRKRIAEVTAKMNAAGATDFVELGKLQKQVDEANAALEALEEEWLELSETLEG